MNYVYLVILVLHVLCGALWVGVAVFAALFLTPAARDLGPDGFKMMLALRKRGFVAYVPIIATISVLTGFWLYWRFTGGFSPEVSRSHSGMAFGLGGLLGLTSFIVGGALIGPSIVKAMKLSGEAASLPDGREKADRLTRAASLRARADAVGRLVAVLLVFAMILMVTARYI